MGNAREFENIVLCLATFHMKKFIVKHLRNNGAESIWTQNSVFVPNVVKSVLDGTHDFSVCYSGWYSSKHYYF